MGLKISLNFACVEKLPELFLTKARNHVVSKAIALEMAESAQSKPQVWLVL